MTPLSSSGFEPLRWRSLLFVPGHLSRFTDRAHERGADAIILDLEDSVPFSEKSRARDALAAAATKAGQNGASVLVRVNRGLRPLAADLDAAVIEPVSALVLPKVESADWVAEIADAVSELERERGLEAGSIRLVAQIESPLGLSRANAIASAHSRLIAITLGPEDFSAAVGGTPDPALLMGPNLLILFAARAAGLMPLGFVGSIADYSDMKLLRDRIVQAKQLGFVGACAVHPSQVEVLNDGFTPNRDEVDWATRVVAAEAEARANGMGAFSLDGKMIDAPVLRRANEILMRSA
jgi:citrate lyase subunit beta / citryl-CoA lyase